MSQLPNVAASLNGTNPEQPFGTASSLNDLDLDDFLDLMIAELQNQDPLNPLENDELVAQISQIREVGATDRLTSTLEAVLLGQNIASATNLIGAEVDALSDDNHRVTGVVSSISIANGAPKLHLDLNPAATVSQEEGDIEAGTYQYRVVWRDQGRLFGIDPLDGDAIAVATGEAIQISNLPITGGPKQVYRTDGSGSGRFRLVGTITSGSDSSFLDDVSNQNLSETVLSGQPQLLRPEDSIRSFTVSLNNVATIRPPDRIVQGATDAAR